MKKKKLKEMIQKPLRFHHQDIHEELEEIKGMLKDVISKMQELQCRVDKQQQDSVLRLSQPDDGEGGQGFSLGPK